MLATQDVCALDTIHLSDDDLGERLVRKRHVIDLMELSFAREAAEFAATNDYEQDGSTSPIDWIRINCHMTGNAAADRVAVGGLVGELEQTVEALVDGQVGFAHLTVMARTANAVGGNFNEKVLLDQARENSPGKFHYICRHYRHSVDPKGYAAEEVELVENRRLSLSTWDDGSLLLSGVLDPASGAALRTALEPLARKSGADDDRNRERRLADALVDLSMHALDSGLIPQQASQRTHLQVTTTLETLRGLPGAAAAEMSSHFPSRPR